MQRIVAGLSAVAMLTAGMPAGAQEAVAAQAAPSAIADKGAGDPVGPAMVHLEEAASPFGPSAVTNADAASVAMPKLAYSPDAATAEGHDKYYYFHREGTDFATAYADIRECDGYARGMQSGVEYVQVPYPYAGTMAGAVGGAIGNALAAAIFGSAEKRRMRRVNMRTCMGFKGYGRYGLSKELWEEFNFEEGFSGVEDGKRDRYLRQQALVAASAKPEAKELGL